MRAGVGYFLLISLSLYDRIGLNGYRKTDLDLDIERELREMMESGESETKTESRKFKIFSLISMIAIAGLAIFRFIHRMI